jgi:2-keto-4-pentenoate hydratase/2-oxohepta-3-ene-1,7-dioic acid hydratase in catechol pathway
MRLVMFRADDAAPRPGALVDDAVVPLPAASLEDLLSGGRAALERAYAEASRSGVAALPLADVTLTVPLQPSVVVAPGPTIAREHADRLRAHREFYLKSAHTVVAGEGELPYREALGALSYRAQLGLVLGPGKRGLDARAVRDHVLGVVLAAELYSVDLLRVGWEGTMWHVRYGEGASFDGACPVGRVFVTLDELALGGLRLEDRSGLQEIEEDVLAEFVAYVSRWMQLGPTTLVLAGSTHGPRLAVEHDDPVVAWPDGEPRLGAGDRVSARANVLGEINVVVGGRR